MVAYSIWIVSPKGDMRSNAFNEVAIALKHGFALLGHQVPVVRDPDDITGIPVVLGCNLLREMPNVKIPKNAILYNFEQVYDGSPWLTQDYLDLLRSYMVWDYSPENVRRLTALGVERLKLCRVGYEPELSDMPQPDPAFKDIDVLLYGLANERRRHVIDTLKSRGWNAVLATNVYGDERNALIERSRIVINVHYYSGHIFEIVRVSYLLANHRFVVSETGIDADLEYPFREAVAFADYDNLVDTCHRYLEDEVSRRRVAERGFEIFSQIRQSDELAALL